MTKVKMLMGTTTGLAMMLTVPVGAQSARSASAAGARLASSSFKANTA